MAKREHDGTYEVGRIDRVLENGEMYDVSFSSDTNGKPTLEKEEVLSSAAVLRKTESEIDSSRVSCESICGGRGI